MSHAPLHQAGFAPLGTVALGQMRPVATPALRLPSFGNGFLTFCALGQFAVGQAVVTVIRNNPRAPVHPKGTRTLEIPWTALVTQADPDWRRSAHDVVEFEFGGGKRIFRHDPTKRGPYADD